MILHMLTVFGAYRANGEWRLLIFDGFESHLHLELVEFCLDNKIIPFCLPAHTSHVLQPLDVGVFSAMKTYYRQEVSKLHIAVTKNKFPNLFAAARKKAFTLNNIQSGFRATGISPYNPSIILNTLSLPEPEITLSKPPPPIPAYLQAPYELLSFNPATPTTPRSIQHLYLEALSTLDSNSPWSTKQRVLFTKLKMAAEQNAARVVMHEAGEKHLREEIKKRDQKGKVDTRHINTKSACVVERETVLYDMKKKRDEKEIEEQERKEKREQEKEVKASEKERKEQEMLAKMQERKQKALEREEEKQRKAEERAKNIEQKAGERARKADEQ